MVDQIVTAGVYLVAGLVLGHSFTVVRWDRDQRKARKQANRPGRAWPSHDAQVSWLPKDHAEAMQLTIDRFLKYRPPADD